MINPVRRRFGGVTVVIAMVAMLTVLFSGSALAQIDVVDQGSGPGEVCPKNWNDGHLTPGAVQTGSWGTARSSASGVDVSVNAGYVVEVCVKAGTQWIIYRVEGTEKVPSPEGKSLSHWALRVVEKPSSTSTTVRDTSTSSSTSTTVGDTSTSTTVGDTSTSTTVADTSSTTSTTVRISPTSTAPETTTTIVEAPTSSTVPLTSTTVVVKPTTTRPDSSTTTPSMTDDTLPFTGVDSDQLAIVALLALGAGSGLVAMSRKNTEDARDL